MAEHIVAVFETETDATAAARSLESVGIPSSAIRQYADTARFFYMRLLGGPVRVSDHGGTVYVDGGANIIA